MKVLLVLIGFIASCVCNVIPSIPGDNSNYVEGVNRYIWMPDGEGVPQLVDLEQSVYVSNPRSGADNQYWLYTRENPINAEILINGDAESIRSSNYNSSRPLIVLVHGWYGSANSEDNILITSAVLEADDVNVIVLDWHVAASLDYVNAVASTLDVGEYLASFLEWLTDTDDEHARCCCCVGPFWNNLHLIGFGLGAHVIGVAGRQVGGRPGRVTGLDPSGPLWNENPNALDSNAGRYVEAIHTDGGSLGIFTPIADADFYPNGGRNPQPGCAVSTCSHNRAPELFASSVITNHFEGRLCDDINQAENVQCSGSAFNMGNAISNKRGSGIYGLATGSNWPF